MNPREPKLDTTLVWDETGCLADPAVHALADGEVEVLPEEALNHAETCAECADKIGSAALLALEVADAVARFEAPVHGVVAERALRGAGSFLPSQPRAAARRRPVPVLPLAIALAVAFVAILPTLNTLAPQFIQMRAFSAVVLPLLAQLIVHGSTRAAQSGLLVSVAWLSAGLLLLGGLAVARVAQPQPRTRSRS